MADARLTPARPDLAAAHLKSIVAADRYVEGTPQIVFDAVVPVRKGPSHDAELQTQALKGERVTIYDLTEEGWAWGQLDGDGYVGWLPNAALLQPNSTPTHHVTVPLTFAFPGPSIKLPPYESLPLGAQITVVRETDTFVVTDNYSHIPKHHVAPLALSATDFVAIAEQFLHTPYLWGGKSFLGIDCSGLVQIALDACGVRAPRDSDMQMASLGNDVAEAEWGELKRGDLIFWKGHVAIVGSNNTIVHANAHHMAVAIEPIAEAVDRIGAAGSGIIAVKRLA